LAKRKKNDKTEDHGSLDNRDQRFTLRLFITGTTPRSVQAISNIKKLCEEHLTNYDLEVIDIYQQPERAREDQIIAVPTLIKELPKPLRKFIGDMSDTGRILIGLNLVTKDKT